MAVGGGPVVVDGLAMMREILADVDRWFTDGTFEWWERTDPAGFAAWEAQDRLIGTISADLGRAVDGYVPILSGALRAALLDYRATLYAATKAYRNSRHDRT